MRNLILYQTHIFNLINTEPLGYHLDEFSKILVILDKNMNILIYQYEDVFTNFKLIRTLEFDAIFSNNMDLLNELISEPEIKFLFYKNEEESIHLILKSGKYIKINSNEKYEITNLYSEENSKVLAVETSPNLENIILVLSNFKILLLNYEFEVVNGCDLDDGDLSNASADNNICEEASISWRGDSQYFCVLYSINGGKKCLVRDTKLNVFKSPARADNKVVFSVAENPVKSI